MGINQVKIKDRKKDIEFLRMGLNMCGIKVDYTHTDLISKVFTIVNEKKGKSDMKDMSLILAEWETHWNEYFRSQENEDKA